MPFKDLNKKREYIITSKIYDQLSPTDEQKREPYCTSFSYIPLAHIPQLLEPQLLENEGFIYCASNNSFNGLYKIGFTKGNPIERVKQLNNKITGFIQYSNLNNYSF